MALIDVQKLTKEYRLANLVTPVLDEVSFSVDEGEFLSIIGPSGSGKTTLLNLLGGLDRDYTGSLKIADREMKSLSDRQISLLRSRTIGFIFQSFHLLEHLTCLENVMLPYFFAGRPTVEAQVRARQLLEKVGVGDKEAVRPIYISGDVQVAIGELSLSCDSLEVTYHRGAEGSVDFLASGAIRVERPGLVATSGKAQYEGASGALTLTESPRVEGDVGVLEGTRIVLDVDDETVTVDDVRGTFRVRQP